MAGFVSANGSSVLRPLHGAAHSGDESVCSEVIQQLRQQGILLKMINSIAGEDGFTPALLAADAGSIPVLKQLISAGADIHVVSNQGLSMLHLCAAKGHQDVCLYLVKLYRIADILKQMLECRNNDGQTPILTAAAAGHYDTVKTLADAGANLTVVDEEKWSLLHWCAMRGDERMCSLVVDQCRESDVLEQILEMRSAEGETSALVAAAHNQLAVLKLLVSAGANVRATFAGGSSVLHWCAEKGYEDMLAWLIELHRKSDDFGTILENRTGEGDTAAALAVWSGCLSIVKLLAFAGADMGVTDDMAWSMVHWCALRGHEDVCNWLLEQYRSANALTAVLESPSLEGYTAALVAASNGQLSVLKMLALAGADIAVCDINGFTILHWSAAEGYEDICSWFVELYQGNTSLDEFIDRRTKQDYTAAWIAAAAGHTTILEMLAGAGADLNIVDTNQFSLLHWAAWKGNERVCSWLLDWFRESGELSAMLESRTADGLTVAHIAALENNLSVLQQLARSGANLNAVDDSGLTVLHYAAMKGFDSLCCWILDYLLNNSGLRQVRKTSEEEAAALLLALKAVSSSGIEVTRENSKVLQKWCVANGFDGLCSDLIELYDVSSDLSERIEVRASDGSTATLLAAANGNFAILEKLVEFGADLEAVDNGGRTMLHWCSEKGYVEICTWLTELYRSSGDLAHMMEKRAVDGCTPLLTASMNGQFAVVKHLIDAGCDIEVTVEDGWTLLHLAVASDNLALCEFLIEMYRSINRLSCELERRASGGLTPVLMAGSNGQLEMLKLLIAAGGDTSACIDGGWTLLHQTASRGYESQCSFLIDIYRSLPSGGDMLERRTKTGFTGSMLAALNGHFAVVALLLDAGTSPQCVDNKRRTLLHMATANGHDIMNSGILSQKIGELNPLLNSRSSDGDTALHLALAVNFENVAKSFACNRSVDINIRNNIGRCPLYLAAVNGFESVVKILIDRGADTEATCSEGLTALQAAAANQHFHAVGALLAAGADFKIDFNAGYRRVLSNAPLMRHLRQLIATEDPSLDKILGNVLANRSPLLVYLAEQYEDICPQFDSLKDIVAARDSFPIHGALRRYVLDRDEMNTVELLKVIRIHSHLIFDVDYFGCTCLSTAISCDADPSIIEELLNICLKRTMAFDCSDLVTLKRHDADGLGLPSIRGREVIVGDVKVYIEAILGSSDLLQIGIAASDWQPHTIHTGIGDHDESVGIDCSRQCYFENGVTVTDKAIPKWDVGTVIGVCVNGIKKTVDVLFNGKKLQISKPISFANIKVACLHFP
jgi:ankyrin repeat protein